MKLFGLVTKASSSESIRDAPSHTISTDLQWNDTTVDSESIYFALGFQRLIAQFVYQHVWNYRTFRHPLRMKILDPFLGNSVSLKGMHF